MNVLTSINRTENDLHISYTKDIINIGDSVLNNTNFGLNNKIDYFKFISSNILLKFNDNNKKLKLFN